MMKKLLFIALVWGSFTIGADLADLHSTIEQSDYKGFVTAFEEQHNLTIKDLLVILNAAKLTTKLKKDYTNRLFYGQSLSNVLALMLGMELLFHPASRSFPSISIDSRSLLRAAIGACGFYYYRNSLKKAHTTLSQARSIESYLQLQVDTLFEGV